MILSFQVIHKTEIYSISLLKNYLHQHETKKGHPLDGP